MIRKRLKRMARRLRQRRDSVAKVVSTLQRCLGIPLGIVIALCLVLRFDPPFPNLLGLHSQSLAGGQLTAIAGILASILGIVVAILLVALEILRRTYSHHGFASIFKDRRLTELIVLYSSTAVAALFVAGRLSDPLSHADTSLCHFVFGLFVLAIVVLFPSCQAIIEGAHSERRISALVAAIDHRALCEIRPDPVHEPREHLSEVASNPVYVLGQAVARLIQDDDRVSAQVLLVKTTRRLAELAKQSGDKRRTINAFLSIYNRAAAHALDAQDEGTLRTVLECLTGFHRSCARNHIPWHEVIELNETLKRIVKDCAIRGPENSARLGLYRLGNIMQEHLKANCPKESEVWHLRDRPRDAEDVDHDKSLQWDHIGREYLWMVADIVDSAISARRTDAVSTGLRALLHMTSDATRLDNLGDKQKDELVRWAYYHAQSLTVRSINEGLYEQAISLSPFSSFNISRMLDEERPYARSALVYFGQFIVEAAKRNAVTTFVLNEIGAIGRGAASRAGQSAGNRAALRFIVDILDKVRGVTEDRLAEENRREYIECHGQLESLKTWLLQHSPDQQELTDYCDEAISRFASLKIAREAVEKLAVQWPETGDEKTGNSNELPTENVSNKTAGGDA